VAALSLAQALSRDGPATAATAARLVELDGVERALAMIRVPHAHALIHSLLPKAA
jgi:hypothetical protein